MPISRHEFKDGAKKFRLHKRIVAFLAADREYAFSLYEIAIGTKLIEGTKVKGTDAANIIFLYDTLRSLVSNHKILVRWVDGQMYFRSKH